MKSFNREQQSVVYALLVVLLWSTVATAFKFGLNVYSPAKLIFIAAITSTLILLAYNLVTRRLTKLKTLRGKYWLRSAFLGFINPFVYYIILFKAYSLLPAQVAQPINLIWPIVLSLLAVPFLKHKIGWKSHVALIISFLGISIISSQGKLFDYTGTNMLGVLLAMSSSVIWAFYWIFNVNNEKVDKMLGLLLNFVFGIIYLTIYLALREDFDFRIGKAFWAGIYIGLFETGITFILWIKALALTKNTSRLANLIYIFPFISLLFIHFIIGEKIYYTTLLGLFFIISGILFQQLEKKQ